MFANHSANYIYTYTQVKKITRFLKSENISNDIVGLSNNKIKSDSIKHVSIFWFKKADTGCVRVQESQIPLLEDFERLTIIIIGAHLIYILNILSYIIDKSMQMLNWRIQGICNKRFKRYCNKIALHRKIFFQSP